VRRAADADRVTAFVAELGRQARQPATVYLVGGATAVLHGWRETTRDIDLRIEPDEATGPLGDVIRVLKDELEINVEFASPIDFLPELPGWRDRSPFVARVGPLTIRHLDLYAQALSKVLRDIDHDADDVRHMVGAGLVDPERAWALYRDVAPELRRFPSIDERSYRDRLTAAFGDEPDEAGRS
jgi:hypothetical protein